MGEEERASTICKVCAKPIVQRDGEWQTEDGQAGCYLGKHVPKEALD